MDQIDIYFNHAKDVFNKYSILAVITFVAALFLFIYLVIVTGRRDEFGQVKLYRSDRLITEVQLLIICSLAVMTVLPVWILIETLGDLSMPTWTDNSYNFALLILGIALQTIILSSLLWFILSVVRMFKAHTFLSRSVMVIAVKTLYKWIRAVFSSMNPMGKFILIIVLGCLLCAIWPLIPVIIVLLLGFGYHWIKKYTAIKKGVEEVTNGNLTYKIPVDNRSNSEFDNLARQINTISQASNIAIQNELKNQRLKTDLISNVSHDLKTPLTSIITYTDLLKKEGLSSPNAENYLKVIDEKGQRLKTLTEDLFEAAKVSSGSIPLRMEKVELLSLIRQGLVELDESLQQKGLEVIINSDNDKYYVNADSQLLWRVVENLLNNISKYALDNSRVYIDLKTREDGNKPTPTILFEMKNMSKAPLNIPEDELMERFKRGDESRGTEGSGLGLAIAKDLVRLQNGWFEIKIDGDLFKSTVLLDAYDEDVARATQVMNDEEDKIKQKMMNQDEGGMPRIIN
jgi:signal transduction histidine kinase